MRWQEKWKSIETVETKSIISTEGTADNQWKRFVLKGKVDRGWYYLSIISEGDFWVDAIQFERGGEATIYAPRAELEGAIRSGQLGNVVYDGEEHFDGWFHNSGAKKAEGVLRYRIVDVRETVVAEGVTKPVAIGPGETIKEKMTIKPGLRGMFSVTYTLDKRKMSEGELVYLNMPKPSDKPTFHQLGANMHAKAIELAVHSRAGVKWALTCKTREFGAAGEGAHPEPGVWNWYDEKAQLPRQNKMDLFPCFWPDRIPEFMRTDKTETIRGRNWKKHNFDLWKEHVSKVASHYKDSFKVWCLEDETECSWSAAHIAELINVTSDVMRKDAPGVKLGISAYPTFQEEIFQYVDPAKLDWLGGSYFDFDYWEGRKVRRMSKRYNKPTVSYGVGGRPPEVSMYHTLYTYEPIVYSRAARMARRMVNNILVQNLTIPGHYASIISNDGNHVNRNKPLLDYDGTPLPWGGTFSCVGTLLADAELLGDIPLLGDKDRRAYIFKTPKEVGAVTWATSRRSANHWWRPAERELKGFSLRCAEGSIEALDMYWNKKDVKWQKDELKIDLNEEPVFFMDRGLGKEGLIRALTTATASPPELHGQARLVSSSKGGIELEVKVKNDSSADLKGVTVDLRCPKGTGCEPWSVAGQWLVKKPYAEVGDLTKGEEKTVRLATNLDGKTPYEVGQIRIYLKSKEGKEGATDDCIWFLPSERMTPRVDGKLDEWQGRSAAWLWYNIIWSLVGRYTQQLDEGGEHFSYPSYRLDARASFWSGWDENNLYVGMKLEDDQPILDEGKGEEVSLVIQGDNESVKISLKPEAGGGVRVKGLGEVVAKSALTERKGINGELGKLETLKSVDMEAAIPWKQLKIKPETNRMLGFDLSWSDVDREEKEVVSGTLRWAGESSKGGHLMLTSR